MKFPVKLTYHTYLGFSKQALLLLLAEPPKSFPWEDAPEAENLAALSCCFRKRVDFLERKKTVPFLKLDF